MPFWKELKKTLKIVGSVTRHVSISIGPGSGVCIGPTGRDEKQPVVRVAQTPAQTARLVKELQYVVNRAISPKSSPVALQQIQHVVLRATEFNYAFSDEQLASLIPLYRWKNRHQYLLTTDPVLYKKWGWELLSPDPAGWVYSKPVKDSVAVSVWINSGNRRIFSASSTPPGGPRDQYNLESAPFYAPTAGPVSVVSVAPIGYRNQGQMGMFL
jgi:hypothetical protein